jgi:PAS domain S-box-containing protein
MQATEHARPEPLLAAQKHCLELVLAGAPLHEVLAQLAAAVEEQAGGRSVASILLLDEDGRLRNGGSPSLPQAYLEAIDGIPANADTGTCAAAAALGTVVVTPDIEAAPGWRGLAHLPLALGFRSAWSMPILGSDGGVLGTFGTYFRECRLPTALEREVVEVLARTAAIAIERTRAEQRLREREAFNRRLLESSGDCIKVLDLQGRLLSMNEAGRQLMEIDDLSDVLGRDFLSFWADDDRTAAEHAFAAALAGREGRFEGYCPTARGTSKWWDALVTPVCDDFGRPARILVVSRDVTEQRRTQDELRVAKEEAESASIAKSQFLAVMSHELRTPLTGMIGYADLLATGVAGPLTEQQLSHVRRINTGAWHLVSIIDEILTFSRLEFGKETVRAQRVNMTRLLRESTDLLQPHAAEKGIDLRLVAPDEAVEISTDAGKVRQIILNLTGNALKFTEEGFVEITVTAHEGGVDVRVQDSGPGIAADKLESIFQPFVQIDQSSTRTKGGTGLGLAVSRSLAERLGGDVTVASSEGLGTTFLLRLPDLAPRPEQAEAAQSALEPGLAPR